MTTKRTIEIRDPLHGFIDVFAAERMILDCPAFQRLRHIHQLALTYLVYPSATHRRFEHSLGVMELATRIFDTVTDPKNLASDAARDIVPGDEYELLRSRRLLRAAALCHDTGHLPFSHAAEDELLPDGIDHEVITKAIIHSDEMASIWKEMGLDAEAVSAIAVEPEDAGDLGPWDAILNEIITGDVFGADRMDYLLRDSLHAGVAYGRFDHLRLIDSLRILPPLRAGGGEEGQGSDPQLGVRAGGIQAAESLLLARYFMFSQVYLHRTRRIYDIHLKDFLKEWLPGGNFSIDLRKHLTMTDNEVNSALLAAARDEKAPGHVHAARIVERRHFKVLYKPTTEHLLRNAGGAKQLFSAAIDKFGEENVRYDRYQKGGSGDVFPVLERNGEVVASTSLSEVFDSIPWASSHYVFMADGSMDKARAWLDQEFEQITEPRDEDEDH